MMFTWSPTTTTATTTPPPPSPLRMLTVRLLPRLKTSFCKHQNLLPSRIGKRSLNRTGFALECNMARVHQIKTKLSGRDSYHDFIPTSRETTCVRLETNFWAVRSLSHIYQVKARWDIKTGAGLLSCHVAVCSVFISFKWDKGFKCSKSKLSTQQHIIALMHLVYDTLEMFLNLPPRSSCGWCIENAAWSEHMLRLSCADLKKQVFLVSPQQLLSGAFNCQMHTQFDTSLLRE